MAQKTPSQDELLEKVLENTEYFKDQDGNRHIIITDNGTSKILDVPSEGLVRQLRMFFLRRYSKIIDTSVINQVMCYLEAFAYNDNTPVKSYFPRVGQIEGTCYYNLGNSNQEMVVISKDGVEIVDNSNMGICFKPSIEQTSPNLDTKPNKLLSLLKPLFRAKDEQQLLLLAVYIISCFVYPINHPVLVLYGSQGSAKSTTIDTIGKIIDPNKCNRLALGNDRRNLVTTLSGRYFTAFDNLQVIKQWQSDLFCNVCTGGSESIRQLYTTDSIKELNLKGCLCLNGIDVSVVAGDLLDRSILIELTRIRDEEYMTEKEYNSLLTNALPNILGAAFNALSEAMKIFDEIDYCPRSRMADFVKLGYCIAEILTPSGGKLFEQAYLENKKIAKSEVKLPLALECICSLMKGQAHWEGTMTDLRDEIQPISKQKGYKSSQFPASPSALSRQIRYIKDELQNYGIEYLQKSGGKRMVTITNKNYSNFSVKN